MANEAIILDTPDQINAWQLLSWKSRLSLEMKGLKFRDGSTYAFIKREFNLRGNKQKVYDDYCALLREAGVLKDDVQGS